MSTTCRLYEGSCLDLIPTMTAHCIFADPFDNLGKKYEGFKDKMPHAQYVQFLQDCLEKFTVAAPIVWISFFSRYTVDMGEIAAKFLRAHKSWECKPCVQVFTFGEHNQHDLGLNHRPLWRFKHKDASLYPDQIRVASWRQRNGDKRADPRGRVPGDVLDFQNPRTDFIGCIARCQKGILGYVQGRKIVKGETIWVGYRLEDNGEWQSKTPTIIHRVVSPDPGDVFDFPRVTGNSKQRCDWHPTQLHEDMIERCVKLSTKDGADNLVIDAFGGTGTTLRVCSRIGRRCYLIEKSPGYCEMIAQENKLALYGEHNHGGKLWMSTAH
jgi:hypothetical protein